MNLKSYFLIGVIVLGLGECVYTQAENASLEESPQTATQDVATLVSEVNEQAYKAYDHFVKALEPDNSLKDPFPTPEKLHQLLETYLEDLDLVREREMRRLTPFFQDKHKLVSQYIDHLDFDKDHKEQVVMNFSKDASLLRPGDETVPGLEKFLRMNKTAFTNMPLSYQAGAQYWQKVHKQEANVDEMIERLITSHSVSIYDAAMWQIALMLSEKSGENDQEIDEFTTRLMDGRSGEIQDIRAYDDPFRYGDGNKRLARQKAFFFRIISDEYIQLDPKDGTTSLEGYPNFDLLHHEDWKPIAGEQAWAAIIGPLQTAYQRYGQNIPMDCDQMKLALSLLDALEAMQSPIGAIYHAPKGTSGKDPRDISNENNFSMYAALKMLRQAIGDRDPYSARRIDSLLAGMERYFYKYAYNVKEGVFYQGGFYSRDHWVPNPVFAVDCQTWGTVVLGAQWIDDRFGQGTANRIWQNTKARAGYYIENKLYGVGFTEGHHLMSIEWTCGAILNCRLLGQYYAKLDPGMAQSLTDDGSSMREGVEHYKVKVAVDQQAYLYSSQRSFIPFGWWANPIPSIVSTAWVIAIDKNFNPFVLGG